MPDSAQTPPQKTPQPTADETRRALMESADLRDLAERVRVAKQQMEAAEAKRQAGGTPRNTPPKSP